MMKFRGCVYMAQEVWKISNKCCDGHGITKNYSDYSKVQGITEISETRLFYVRTITRKKCYLFPF